MNNKVDSKITKYTKGIFLFVLPNIITGLTLFVLWSSLKVTEDQIELSKEQFKVINQGYLHVEPTMALGHDKLDLAGRAARVPDGAPFQALLPRTILKNVGHMPIRYEVLEYDTYINDQNYSDQIDEKDAFGILYPGQQLGYSRTAVYFDRLEHREIQYKQIKDLKIKNTLRIKYFSINTPADIKYVIREFRWSFQGNISRLHYDSFGDKI